MSNPQEQFGELSRRTQESFRSMWQQWSDRSTELLKGMTGRAGATPAGGSPEQVLDAVFDFAEHLIAQQRVFAKQMLAAASAGQQLAEQSTTAPTSPPSTEGGGSATVRSATEPPGPITPPGS
jgi:hypothetical protein